MHPAGGALLFAYSRCKDQEGFEGEQSKRGAILALTQPS